MAAATTTMNVRRLAVARAPRRPAVTRRDRDPSSPRPAPSVAARWRNLTATVAGCFALGIFVCGFIVAKVAPYLARSDA